MRGQAGTKKTNALRCLTFWTTNKESEAEGITLERVNGN